MEVASTCPRGARPRFIFYSNELVGLGHLRRTLAVAGQLVRSHPSATSLVLTGSAITPFFRLPPGVDVVKLPSTTRDDEGRQRSQRLGLEMDQLQEVRSSIALATAITFRPDVAVVDKHPLGLGGELEPTLAQLKMAGCALVLGLRDIDDSPEAVRHKWAPALRGAIERYYDAVLVYGPPGGPDALDCLGWNDVAVPVDHVGYLASAPPPAEAAESSELAPGYVLATVGGGRDGFPLLAGVARALRVSPLPCPVVMVTGPLMPERDVARLRALARGTGARVWRFRNDLPGLIAGARGVVTMAGYNTVAEVVAARKPMLMVPRVRPSEEQLVRACRLAAAGAGDLLHPDALTPEAMREALGRLVERPAPKFRADHHRGGERAAAAIAALAGLGTTEPGPAGHAAGGNGRPAVRPAARPREATA